MEKNGTNQNYQIMIRHIGSTTYKVKVVLGENGEPLEDKILRMIRHEAMDIGEKSGIMETPLMSRQSERSAV